MRDFDPYLLEVLRSAFDTIADNLAITLMRTAYSEIVRESLDFSTALCDRNGLVIAQGVCTALHLGSFHDPIQLLITSRKGDIDEGDIFIFNDPFLAMGQHLPDVYVVKPVFVDARIEGWVMTVAHHSDVGGIVAGSNALGAHEVFQEGLRLPILKLYERRTLNECVWSIIQANVRTPHLVAGDLHAQVAACKSGEREFLGLIAQHGIEIIREATDALHDYAERLTRAELAEFPRGRFEFEDHIDGLGDALEPLRIRAAVSFEGDRVSVDWAGSSPQVQGGLNSVLPFTKAAVYTAIRSVMHSNVPNCHGFTKPIDVHAPAGSMLNPLFPAATGARGLTGYRMIDCLFGALSVAMPDRVPADGSGGSSFPTFSGPHNGSRFVFCETLMGTSGATRSHDGQEGVAHVGANQANVPVELIESRYPLRIEEYAIVPDSGGPGEFRGGLSLRRTYRILADNVQMNIRSDKRAHRPHGLFGGGEGGGSLTVIHRGDGRMVIPAMPTVPLPLLKGDLVEHTMPGGGGWGDPSARALDAISDDIGKGKLSPAAAERQYGVAVDLHPLRVRRSATGRGTAAGKASVRPTDQRHLLKIWRPGADLDRDKNQKGRNIMEGNSRRRAMIAGGIGHLLEVYDFTVYAFVAINIARAIFPSTSETASMLAAFLAFGLGFLSRPLGGIAIGYIGDRYGSKTAFTASLLLIGFATLGLGLTPTYEQIGWLAPVLVVIWRMAQGLSFGGEWAASATYLVSIAPPERRGLYGSLQQVGSAIGALLGSAVGTLLAFSISAADMAAWGWRVPFIAGSVMIVVAFYIRRSVMEAPDVNVTWAEPTETSEVVSSAKRAIRLIIFAGAWAVPFYLNLFYMPTYAQRTLGLDQATALLISTIALSIYAVAIAVTGHLSDVFGRRPIIFIGCIGTALSPLVFMMIVANPTMGTVVFGQLCLNLPLAFIAGPGVANSVEMFPPRRLVWMATGYSVALAIFGGFTPAIVTALVAATGSPISPSILLVAAAALIAGVLLVSPETSFRRKAGGSRVEDAQSKRAPASA